MNIEKERELFDKWHYERYLQENPNIDINNARYIYDYAHNNLLVSELRESHFAVWLASANRDGYKLVPVDELNRIVADTTDLDTYNDLKAMLGAAE